MINGKKTRLSDSLVKILKNSNQSYYAWTKRNQSSFLHPGLIVDTLEFSKVGAVILRTGSNSFELLEFENPAM